MVAGQDRTVKLLLIIARNISVAMGHVSTDSLVTRAVVQQVTAGRCAIYPQVGASLISSHGKKSALYCFLMLTHLSSKINTVINLCVSKS